MSTALFEEPVEAPKALHVEVPEHIREGGRYRLSMDSDVRGMSTASIVVDVVSIQREAGTVTFTVVSSNVIRKGSTFTVLVGGKGWKRIFVECA